MLLENYSGGRGIGKSGLVETVHVCSSRRRDKCSAYCLLWKLRLGSEPGKTRFTIFIRIIYITQLGHPLFRTPPLGAINRKDVIKKIKITLVDLKKNCARRTRSVRSYANGSTRIRIVLVPLPGLPSTGEKRRGRDLSFVASPIRYLSQVPCQRTVKVPWFSGWMFHAINSTDINRGKGRMEVDGGGGAKWFEVVKRRCAGSNLPFNALSLVSRPPLRWNTHAV